MLGEGPTSGIIESFSSAEKYFSIHFSKSNTKFCLCLQYNPDNSYLFLNGNKIFRFKADNEMLTFQVNFVLEVYLMNLALLSLG